MSTVSEKLVVGTHAGLRRGRDLNSNETARVLKLYIKLRVVKAAVRPVAKREIPFGERKAVKERKRCGSSEVLGASNQ